jgi:ribonuclease T
VTEPDIATPHPLSQRFRGFYPVVIDIETTGFDCQQHGILEISAALPSMDEAGRLIIKDVLDFAIIPHRDAVIDPSSIAFHGIDPADPDRHARPEADAFCEMLQAVRLAQKQHDCQRSILVAHNAQFDQGFLRAAIARNQIKRDPFHPFSSFDTATLAALACGQTVLAKACEYAGIDFNNSDAHSAAYDTRRTAELFCWIVNQWKLQQGAPK